MEGKREKSKNPLEIPVVGVGGAGNNMVHRLNGLNIQNLRPMAVNTDKVHIEIIDCPTKILIGEDLTHGLGAAGCPEIGEECALKAKEELSRIIGKPDILFVVAGMGGGTGTGASVVIARIARENGAFVVAVVSMPFTFEGRRKTVAERGLENLRDAANCVIVIDNDRLMEIGGNLPVEDAFSIVDHLISGLIDNISRNISLPDKIPTDIPIETAPFHLTPITLQEEEEEVEDMVTEGIQPPPLVKVDIGGMAEMVKNEEPRSIQGLRMAEHVVNEMRIPVEMPKKSNVLISETRPLTLLPFLLPQDEKVHDKEYIQEFLKKNRFGPPRPFKGGTIVKKVKELEEKDNAKTTRPMTQTRLDNIWV